MKVKIVKAKKHHWYYECVGLTFEVTKSPYTSFMVDETRGIDVLDCEIVEESCVATKHEVDNDLRDRLALAAMQSIIAKAPHQSLPNSDTFTKCEQTARGAYYYADAMLKVRSGE